MQTPLQPPAAPAWNQSSAMVRVARYPSEYAVTVEAREEVSARPDSRRLVEEQ